MDRVIYVHGKGGSAKEAGRFAPLFPGWVVEGIDYKSDLPWDAAEEIEAYIASRKSSGRIILIANSIGAYYSMLAGVDRFTERAFFISPVVDMEKLIREMMARERITEKDLAEKSRIKTNSGETLDIKYLSFVKEHPAVWSAPLEILCGSEDKLVSIDDAARFAEKAGAGLCVMKGGEHWFHTEEQMRFLDQWIKDRLHGEFR